MAHKRFTNGHEQVRKRVRMLAVTLFCAGLVTLPVGFVGLATAVWHGLVPAPTLAVPVGDYVLFFATASQNERLADQPWTAPRHVRMSYRITLWSRSRRTVYVFDLPLAQQVVLPRRELQR